jgi:hypothetical protein
MSEPRQTRMVFVGNDPKGRIRRNAGTGDWKKGSSVIFVGKLAITPLGGSVGDVCNECRKSNESSFQERSSPF